MPHWFGKFGVSYEPVNKNVGFSLGFMGKFDKLEVQVKANYLEEPKKTSYGGSGKVEWQPDWAGPFKLTGDVGADTDRRAAPNMFTGMDTKKVTTDIKMNVGLKYEF